jgi:DNA-binding NarL/FixJ family response regulator
VTASGPPTDVRIVLADDHAIFIQGLRALLDDQDGLQVVSVASDGHETVRAVREHAPDVVLMDVTMPGMNGIEATRRIRAESPAVKVLCLSMHAEARFVTAMIEAGAAGYLPKDCDAEELMRAIRAVRAGQVYLSPAVAGAVVDGYRATTPAGDPDLASLTDREREVLQLIAEGLATKEIAERLNLSPKTVASHRENIMGKLEIRSVAGLTKFALRHGLTGA